MIKNVAKSIEAAQQVSAKPRLCYANAADLMLRIGYIGSGTYVEGVIHKPGVIGVLVEHGWIEFDGEIIDPTLPQDDWVYHAAHRWPSGEFLDLYPEGSLPFFRRQKFCPDGVHVEMDRVRREIQGLS